MKKSAFKTIDEYKFFIESSKHLFDAMPYPIWWKDRKHLYFHFNQTSIDVIKCKSMINQHDEALPWAKYAEDHVQFTNFVIKNGFGQGIVPICSADGKEFTMFVTEVSILNNNGAIIAVVGHGSVVTGQHICNSIQVLNEVDWKNFGSTVSQKQFIDHYQYKNHTLTQQESLCLFYVLRGKTSKEIANIISRSPRTIETHLENIKYKFDSRNKSELIAKASSNGLMQCIPKIINLKKLSDQL